MEPHVFLRLLLQSRGLKPTTFLRQHGLERFQSSVSRYLAGKTSTARKDWVQPVAKALRIPPDALWVDAVASAEAERLGVLTAHRVTEPPPAHKAGAIRPRQARIDPGILVHQIADLMRGFDQDLRDAAAPLFRAAAAQPERADEMATKLRHLLTADSHPRESASA